MQEVQEERADVVQVTNITLSLLGMLYIICMYHIILVEQVQERGRQNGAQ